MSELSKRVMTAAVLTAIIISCILGGSFFFLILVLSINLLGVSEFYKLFSICSLLKVMGLLLSTGILLVAALVIMDIIAPKYLLIIVPVTFFIFVSQLYTNSENHFQQLAFTFFGIIYLTVPLLFLFSIPFQPLVGGNYHPYRLLGFVLIIWASDTGAYFAGKNFGKHKLFERIVVYPIVHTESFQS